MGSSGFAAAKRMPAELSHFRISLDDNHVCRRSNFRTLMYNCKNRAVLFLCILTVTRLCDSGRD